MPTFSGMQLPPPESWEEFETICCDLWSRIWQDPKTQKNGRQGQPQNGVDIVGQPKNTGLWAGIQCKGKDSYSSKKLTIAELHEEVEKAKTFQPQIKEYIIATSGPKDTIVEQEARNISDKHSSEGLFTVTVLGWEDIKQKFVQYPDLLSTHYPQLKPDTTAFENFIEGKYCDQLKVLSELSDKFDNLSSQLLSPPSGSIRIDSASQSIYNIASMSEDKDKYLSLLYESAKQSEKYNDNKQIKELIENRYLLDPDCAKHKSYASMLNNLGKVYFEEDDIGKAIYYIKKAYNENQKETKFALNLSNLYALNDNYEEAELLLSSMPDVEDLQLKADVINIKSLIAAYKGDINSTLELLTEALALVPGDDVFLMNKGYFLCRKGEFPEGLKLLRQVFERNKDKIIYLKCLAFCLTQFHMSTMSIKKGAIKEGYSTYYFKIIDGDKHKVEITDELVEAGELYDKLIAIKGNSIEEKTLINASGCFMQLGKFEKALEINNLLLKPDSKIYDIVLKNRGVIFVYLDRVAQALECFKEYVKKYPKDAIGYMNLGQAYLHLDNNNKEALEYFIKAHEIDGNDPYIIACMATALGRMKCYKPSIEKASIAIEMGLRDYIIYLNKGISEYHLNYYGNARQSFLLSLELDHQKIKEKEILTYLALCAAKMKDTDEALGYIEKLRCIDPADNEIKYNHAELLFKKGNICEAEILCTEILASTEIENLRTCTLNLMKGIQSRARKIIIPK